MPCKLMGPDECKLVLLDWWLPFLFLFLLLKWAADVFVRPFLGGVSCVFSLRLWPSISSSRSSKSLRSKEEAWLRVSNSFE